MLHLDRNKTIAVILVCLASLLFSLPNFFSKEQVAGWPSWLPGRQMPLGLDLQGGAHLLLEMNKAELTTDWLQTLRDEARRQLREAKIGFSGLGVAGERVEIQLADPARTEAAEKALRKLVQPIGNAALGTSADDITVRVAGPGVIIITPTEQGLRNRIQLATSAALETIRKRVDPSGTTEATVVPQGIDRVLVQVPGVKDIQDLKDRLGKTAKLTFHAVHPTLTPDEAQATRLPQGYKVYEAVKSTNPDDRPEPARVLQETPIVSGEDLIDAQQGFDQDTNEPIILFRFNMSGARKFGKFTAENVGRPFAAVLDGEILSAPNILQPIPSGSGQISGNFTVESAKELATQLRSGALPASLQIIEERTVGPSLGADSIEAGKLAMLMGFIGVALFLTASYGIFGFFAIVALVVNLALVVAALSIFQATLSLPGIAGMVLTMGMSVDANVLINERIRDEIRIGRTPIAALDTGFTRAYGTILDTNITGLIAAAILYFLGSGPISGFAVTLGIGILASAFTATTVTRYLVAGWLRWARPTAIPI